MVKEMNREGNGDHVSIAGHISYNERTVMPSHPSMVICLRDKRRMDSWKLLIIRRFVTALPVVT